MIASPSDASTTAEVTTTGLGVLVVSGTFWTLGWVVLFYLVRWLQDLWLRHLPLSTKDHENEPNWCARNVLGILHALFIAVISLPCFFVLVGASDEVKFAASSDLATCALVPNSSELRSYLIASEAVAFAGLAFTTFTIADVFISSMYGLVTADHLVHHVAFIAVGVVIRSNCMLPYNASILLSMEVSTPFLNYCTLMLNRGKDYSRSTTVSGTIFAALFIVFRIVLNTCGVVYLCTNYDIAMPLWVQEWEYWFLLASIVAGAIVQYIWLPIVLRKFAQHFGNFVFGPGTPPHTREARSSTHALAGAEAADDTDGSPEVGERSNSGTGRLVPAPATARAMAAQGSTTKMDKAMLEPAAAADRGMSAHGRPGNCFQGACSVS